MEGTFLHKTLQAIVVQVGADPSIYKKKISMCTYTQQKGATLPHTPKQNLWDDLTNKEHGTYLQVHWYSNRIKAPFWHDSLIDTINIGNADTLDAVCIKRIQHYGAYLRKSEDACKSGSFPFIFGLNP